eukprot:1044711-Prymnesium_polylepis.2
MEAKCGQRLLRLLEHKLVVVGRMPIPEPIDALVLAAPHRHVVRIKRRLQCEWASWRLLVKVGEVGAAHMHAGRVADRAREGVRHAWRHPARHHDMLAARIRGDRRAVDRAIGVLARVLRIRRQVDAVPKIAVVTRGHRGKAIRADADRRRLGAAVEG